MTSVRADVPFATPTGWTVAGDLKPGSTIFSASGKPTEVIIADDEIPNAALEVKMVMDPVVVSEDHDLVLGLPWYGAWKGPTRFLEERTRRLIHPLAPIKRVVLDLPTIDLPLDPWTYGFWRVLHLPDGTICVPANLADRARRYLNEAGLSITKTFYDRDVVYLTSPDLANALEKIGHHDGFHPDYLRSGVDQRRELFSGVVDARGRFMNGVTIETARPIIEAVAELAMSLGLRASKPTKGQPRVRMSPHDAVMRLRSDELYEFLHGPGRPGYRAEVPYMIRQAKGAPVGTFVRVKTADGSYLVGKAMLPARDY